jgi:hypothetical protein
MSNITLSMHLFGIWYEVGLCEGIGTGLDADDHQLASGGKSEFRDLMCEIGRCRYRQDESPDLIISP